MLAEEGLAAALVALVEVAGVPAVILEHLEDRRYDADVEMAAYALVDAVVAGSPGDSRGDVVRVAVRERDGWVEVDVTDERGDRARLPLGATLQEVEDRVGALGGSLTSANLAGGETRIRALIPV